MIYEKQPHIDYSFKDINGHQWPRQWVDTYNRYTDDINKSAGVEIKSGSLMQKTRDQLLDNRHRFFMTCVNTWGM